jgi:hypothetical protein
MTRKRPQADYDRCAEIIAQWVRLTALLTIAAKNDEDGIYVNKQGDPLPDHMEAHTELVRRMTKNTYNAHELVHQTLQVAYETLE